MPCSRRNFLRFATTLGGAVLLPHRLWAKPRFHRDPFALGIASGYPQPDGMVLWTRLAPELLAGGDMPQAAVEVRWEVVADESLYYLSNTVQQHPMFDWYPADVT